MLIGSCLESYIVALKSLISCNTVRKNDLIGIAYMRLT